MKTQIWKDRNISDGTDFYTGTQLFQLKTNWISTNPSYNPSRHTYGAAKPSNTQRIQSFQFIVFRTLPTHPTMSLNPICPRPHIISFDVLLTPSPVFIRHYSHLQSSQAPEMEVATTRSLDHWCYVITHVYMCPGVVPKRRGSTDHKLYK